MLQRQLGQRVSNRMVESAGVDFDPPGVLPRGYARGLGPHKAWLQPRAMEPVSGNLTFPRQSFLMHTRAFSRR
jgi:hypothetical protein